MNWKTNIYSLLVMLVMRLAACGNDEVPPFTPNLGDAPVTPDQVLLGNLINDLRAEGYNCSGTEFTPSSVVLTFNPLLNQAAQNHAEYMASQDNLTHEGPNGTSVADRMQAIGYNYTFINENLAKGYADEASVIDAWKNSSTHCKNMMQPEIREMGVGTSGSYWVMLFGAE